MRQFLNAVFFVSLTAQFFLWGGSFFPCRAMEDEDRELHIYTWSGYLDSDVINGFQKKYNCKVWVDSFDSYGEMLATVTASKDNYDIVTPTSFMAARLYQSGLLLKIDHAKIPNLKNLDPAVLGLTDDPDMHYSVPYAITAAGIGYNRRLISREHLGSWALFAVSAYAGRMTMLLDMREAVGAALRYLGYSLNTRNPLELAEASKLLLRWKKNLVGFDVEEAKSGLAEGRYAAIHAYNGDVALLMKDNPDLDFFIPKEGSSLTVDEFVICADTPVSDLAHAFINYMLDPVVAEVNMESTMFYMPNLLAQRRLNPALKKNPAFGITAEVLTNCEVVHDLDDTIDNYLKEWERVLSD